MKINVILLVILSIFIAFSCNSGPQTAEFVPPPVNQELQPIIQNEIVQEQEEIYQDVIQAEEQAEYIPENIAEIEIPEEIIDSFDPNMISEEYYISTWDEVQRFIESQNTIIRNRNYQAWRASLSPEYFAEISSPENLRYISELPAMRTRNIVLRTAEDYFINVVVPSRANLRVGDIEFISLNRVKVFDERGLRLYDLEKINNSWTIIN